MVLIITVTLRGIPVAKKYVSISINGREICPKCEIADNPFRRFMGLMFRKTLAQNQALLLEPCNQIHTFNMRFSIDVVNLSRDNRVISIFENVVPWRARPAVKGGRKVVELNAFEAKKLGISENDVLVFSQAE